MNENFIEDMKKTYWLVRNRKQWWTISSHKKHILSVINWNTVDIDKFFNLLVILFFILLFGSFIFLKYL